MNTNKPFFNLPLINSLGPFERLLLVHILTRFYLWSRLNNEGAQYTLIQIIQAISYTGTKHVVADEYIPNETNMNRMRFYLPSSRRLSFIRELKRVKETNCVNDADLSLHFRNVFDEVEHYNLLKSIIL